MLFGSKIHHGQVWRIIQAEKGHLLMWAHIVGRQDTHSGSTADHRQLHLNIGNRQSYLRLKLLPFKQSTHQIMQRRGRAGHDKDRVPEIL